MTDPPPLVMAGHTALLLGPLICGLLVYLLPWPRFRDAAPIVLSAGLLVVLWYLSGEMLGTGPVTLALGGHFAPLGIELHVDALALAMLWLTGLVGLAVNVHITASVNLTERFGPEGFRILWLVLWSALNALFVAADLFNIYVLLELSAITAIALVAVSRGPEAVAAATRYLFFALAGSLFFLLGVALVYAKTGLLALRGLESLQWHGPASVFALGLMTLGLAMKAALFPVHAWLPRAHAIAPSAASALLSALVAKAGVYLVIRLWSGPFDGHWPEFLGQSMAVLGAAGIAYGSIQAIRQSRLKLVIAYSTVAQLGYLLLVLPLASVLAWHGVIYHALSHGLAKAALFLAAGNVIFMVGNDRLESLSRGDHRLAGNAMVMALAGVSLAGLPPSGGFIGKWWLINAALESGQWWWALVVGGGGLLTAAYVFRVLRYAMAEPHPDDGRPDLPVKRLPRRMFWPPMLLALGAIALGFAGQWLVPILALGRPGNIAG
ncbi:MAG: proton-conducting transporter membrane subunit [Wenzhouxiangellaceae bacterium]